MDSRLITALAIRLRCPRTDSPRYAADCVVRAIQADSSLAPPPPWRIEAGVGVLSQEVGDAIVFNPSARRGIRWGDAAHAVAHPVAVAVDAVAGTNLTNCRACAERRRRWNGL